MSSRNLVFEITKFKLHSESYYNYLIDFCLQKKIIKGYRFIAIATCGEALKPKNVRRKRNHIHSTVGVLKGKGQTP